MCPCFKTRGRGCGSNISYAVTLSLALLHDRRSSFLVMLTRQTMSNKRIHSSFLSANPNKGSATQNISLVLDPRGRIQSLSSLKAEGAQVVEHDAVGPEVMTRLIKDLESPEANPRAAELFAKRQSMAKGKGVNSRMLLRIISMICFT